MVKKFLFLAWVTMSLTGCVFSEKPITWKPGNDFVDPGDRTFWTLSDQPKPGTIVKVSAVNGRTGTVEITDNYIADHITPVPGNVPNYTLQASDDKGFSLVAKFLGSRSPQANIALQGKRSLSITMRGTSALTIGPRNPFLRALHAMEANRRDSADLFTYLESNRLDDSNIGYFIVQEVVTAESLDFKSTVDRQANGNLSCGSTLVACGSIDLRYNTTKVEGSQSLKAVVWVRLKRIGLSGPVVRYSDTSRGPTVAGGAR